jgi:hypothetical protein
MLYDIDMHSLLNPERIAGYPVSRRPGRKGTAVRPSGDEKNQEEVPDGHRARHHRKMLLIPQPDRNSWPVVKISTNHKKRGKENRHD